MASYNWLIKEFGENNVYVASSSVQDPETSPFEFDDKVKMATKLGVPSGHFVNVKNPYQATEITSSLSDEERANTALIFAVSEKDAQRFNFAPKKDGSPSYLQPVPANKKSMKPMTKHGYVAITPTVNFRVKGVDANSASQIRNWRRKNVCTNSKRRFNCAHDFFTQSQGFLRCWRRHVRVDARNLINN
jgi:hypothetical protein